MKKIMITVILATVCQFTFATNQFDCDRGRCERRHHEREYCSRPHRNCGAVMIAPPIPFVGVNVVSSPGIWIEGHWIITRRGYQKWIPGHWVY